jgi:hypothetical protein
MSLLPNLHFLLKIHAIVSSSRYIPAIFVCIEALEPRGSTPTKAPDVPTSEAPEEEYVSVFAYASDEPGDLSFEAGEKMRVIKKETDWWTGQIGDRTGVFPFNYVELVVSIYSFQLRPVRLAKVNFYFRLGCLGPPL